MPAQGVWGLAYADDQRDPRRMARAQRWVEDHVVVPTKDESVVQAVEDRMALEIGDV